MKYLKSILVVFTGLYTPCLMSQVQTVTMEQFLDRLKRAHPLFESEWLNVELEEERKRSYLGDKDWHITSGPYYTRTNPLPQSSLIPETVNQVRLGARAQRLFWKTGGRLSFSWSSDFTDQIGLQDFEIQLDPSAPPLVFDLGPSSYYQNELAVRYVQPLLKNRKGFLDRLEYDLKDFDIDYAKAQAMENQEDFLASMAAKFLDWVLLTEQKRITRDRLELSQEELVRTNKKREANLVDEVDVIRARNAVRIAKRNKMLIESRWKALQGELAVLSRDDALYDARPEFDLYEQQQLPTLEEARTELRRASRLIQSLNIRLDAFQYARKGFEEGLKPNLSLVTELNIKNLDSGFGESLLMDKLDTYVGLEFSIRLKDRNAKAQIIKNDLFQNQVRKQILDLRLSLIAALTNIYIQIEELEEVLRLDVEQIDSARAKTREELQLYNLGRGELTFVIQSQDTEENAKLTYASDALTYQKLIVRYRALMDELL